MKFFNFDNFVNSNFFREHFNERFSNWLVQSFLVFLSFLFFKNSVCSQKSSYGGAHSSVFLGVKRIYFLSQFWLICQWYWPIFFNIYCHSCDGANFHDRIIGVQKHEKHFMVSELLKLLLRLIKLQNTFFKLWMDEMVLGEQCREQLFLNLLKLNHRQLSQKVKEDLH